MAQTTLNELAKTLHVARMRLCWGDDDARGRQPWVGSPKGKWPGDFGYEPQTWIDIAYAQARAVHSLLGKGTPDA